MPSEREVDKIPAITPRPVQMQVLCLGLPCTGVMTMVDALNKLGYNTYHGLVAAMDPRSRADRHMACWREALKFKVGESGRAYSSSDLDKILQYHSAVTDIPCINFSKELIERFPDAKVILTQRDPQAWIKSMDSTILHALSWRAWKVLKYIDPNHLTPFRDSVQLSLEDWTLPAPYDDQKALLEYMSEHEKFIKSLVPADNLLEFHPRDGWEPLCKFLGKQPPINVPFPHMNDGEAVVKILLYVVVREMAKFMEPGPIFFWTLTIAWLSAIYMFKPILHSWMGS